MALGDRQGQDLSRHSAASPTVHILAEGDRIGIKANRASELRGREDAARALFRNLSPGFSRALGHRGASMWWTVATGLT